MVPVNPIWGEPRAWLCRLARSAEDGGSGGRQAVDRVIEAVTEPVSVAGLHETVTETVTVGFVDPSLRVTNPRPATVSVQVQITRGKN